MDKIVAPKMTQPEINTGLLMEFDSVRMRSNLVLVAIYKKGQNFKIFQNYRQDDQEVDAISCFFPLRSRRNAH